MVAHKPPRTASLAALILGLLLLATCAASPCRAHVESARGLPLMLDRPASLALAGGDPGGFLPVWLPMDWVFAGIPVTGSEELWATEAVMGDGALDALEMEWNVSGNPDPPPNPPQPGQ